MSTKPATNKRKPAPNKAMIPIGANRFTLVFIETPPALPSEQSALPNKATRQKILALFLSLSHFAEQRFHVIEILFQRPAPGRRQTVFSFGCAALERLRTADVPGLLEFARVHTQIAVSCLDRVFEFVEGERIIDGQGADDSQAQSLVNHAIDIMRAVRRAAMYAAQPFLLGLSFFWFAP